MRPKQQKRRKQSNSSDLSLRKSAQALFLAIIVKIFTAIEINDIITNMRNILKNQRVVGTLIFSLLFVSVATNIALTQRVLLLQSNTDPDRLKSLEDENFELEKKLLLRDSDIRNLQERVSVALPNEDTEAIPEEDSSDEIISRPSTNSSFSDQEVETQEKIKPIDVAATNFDLQGDCDYPFSTSTTTVSDKLCSIIEAGSEGESILNIINCQAGLYFDKRDGFGGQFCNQGAGVVLGKKTVDSIYIANIVSQDATIVTMDVYQYSFNTRNVKKIDNFFTIVQQGDDLPENAELDNFVKSFSDAYRQYINDVIPEEVTSKFLTN